MAILDVCCSFLSFSNENIDRYDYLGYDLYTKGGHEASDPLGDTFLNYLVLMEIYLIDQNFFEFC